MKEGEEGYISRVQEDMRQARSELTTSTAELNKAKKGTVLGVQGCGRAVLGVIAHTAQPAQQG